MQKKVWNRRNENNLEKSYRETMMTKLFKCPFCTTLAPIEMLKGHIRTAHQWWISELRIGA